MQGILSKKADGILQVENGNTLSDRNCSQSSMKYKSEKALQGADWKRVVVWSKGQ